MRVRSLVSAAAAYLTLGTAPAPALAADADVFLITGSGTFTPGVVPVVPSYQSLSFTGTMTVVGTHGTPSTYPCSFSGSVYGSMGATTGSIAGNCGPLTFWPCTIVWAAPGPAAWACVDPASPAREAVVGCMFTVVDVNPSTRYNLVCTGQYAAA